MRRAGLAALVGLTLALGAPCARAASGYRSDFDFAGHGDAWYGRLLPDPRRDFPANPVDRASDGDDFGRGYLALVAAQGYGPPLELTESASSEYVFIAGRLAATWTADCDGNGIDDQCDLSCGLAGGPCDVPGCGTAGDCDGNGVPDACDLAATASGCSFPAALADNSTGTDDSVFLGPPDDVYYGLGGQVVTYELDCGWIVDDAGPDFVVYEVDTGSAEFGSVDVLVSDDGVDFVSVKSSELAAIAIPGDEMHGNASFARSYDLGPSGLAVARFVRLDGNGSGPAGTGTGFDLDAIGIANKIGHDCDADGTLDVCQGLADCNADGIPESCEVAAGIVDDCDMNGTADTCDTLGGTGDCDGDSVPDSCELDCNGNTVPDDCDILSMTSGDCNGNGVPDECDLTTTFVNVSTGLGSPFGAGAPASLGLTAPFPSGSVVVLNFTGYGDLGATNEYVDVTLNGVPIGTLWQSTGAQCVQLSDRIQLSPEVFNAAVGSGAIDILAAATSAVAPFECATSYSGIGMSYAPIVDCNDNGVIDACDISGATSTDFNLNGIADDCEPDCNVNGFPDDYDIVQGTSFDCNGNTVPDECDTGGGGSPDCNGNTVPDECETDCNANLVPDDCDISSMTSGDCDVNGIPDECDLAVGAGGCAFPGTLLDNSTGADDAIFLGAPDDVYYGLGGQVVTYELDCGFVIDGPGPDLTVYEVDSGSAEFTALGDVLVSADGVAFVSIKSTETAAVAIPGDEQHGSATFARSYDLEPTGLNAVRFVRLDGAGTGSAGTSTGFDLDAIGAVNRTGVDCDGSGVLDRCESFDDCNANALNDACEISAGPSFTRRDGETRSAS